MKNRKLFAGLFILVVGVVIMSCTLSTSVVGTWVDKNETTQYDFKSDSTFIETDIMKGHANKVTGSGKWVFNINDHTLYLTGNTYFPKFSMDEHGALTAPSIFGDFVFRKK